MIQTHPSKFDEVILRHIFVQITFETRKRNTGFYVLRQGVPEGRSSERYASFKQVKPGLGTWRESDGEREQFLSKRHCCCSDFMSFETYSFHT